MIAQDTTKLNRIQRVIYGNELIQELTIKNLEVVLPQLEKFLNKKIKLSDGSKSKNFTIELLKYDFNSLDGSQLRTSLHFEANSLCLFQDVTIKNENYESGGHSVTYYKKDIRIGKCTDGVLTEIENLDYIIERNELLRVFDYNTILGELAEIKLLKLKLADLESSTYFLKY